jgi:hypothetical protein
LLSRGVSFEVLRDRNIPTSSRSSIRTQKPALGRAQNGSGLSAPREDLRRPEPNSASRISSRFRNYEAVLTDDERYSAICQRHAGSRVRGRNVSRWAIVYRKQDSEDAYHPRRSSFVNAVKDPCEHRRGLGKSKLLDRKLRNL